MGLTRTHYGNFTGRETGGRGAQVQRSITSQMAGAKGKGPRTSVSGRCIRYSGRDLENYIAAKSRVTNQLSLENASL